MSDQILTKEEIDALLSAMDKGEVDLEEEVRQETEVLVYNLTSQNIMLRDQFHALEEVYDKKTFPSDYNFKNYFDNLTSDICLFFVKKNACNIMRVPKELLTREIWELVKDKKIYHYLFPEYIKLY